MISLLMNQVCIKCGVILEKCLKQDTGTCVRTQRQPL